MELFGCFKPIYIYNKTKVVKTSFQKVVPFFEMKSLIGYGRIILVGIHNLRKVDRFFLWINHTPLNEGNYFSKLYTLSSAAVFFSAKQALHEMVPWSQLILPTVNFNRDGISWYSADFIVAICVSLSIILTITFPEQ